MLLLKRSVAVGKLIEEIYDSLEGEEIILPENARRYVVRKRNGKRVHIPVVHKSIKIMRTGHDPKIIAIGCVPGEYKSSNLNNCLSLIDVELGIAGTEEFARKVYQAIVSVKRCSRPLLFCGHDGKLIYTESAPSIKLYKTMNARIGENIYKVLRQKGKPVQIVSYRRCLVDEMKNAIIGVLRGE